MPERCLQAENLHLFRGDRHVLRGVRLNVTAGECLQVTGGNGAGKTSLLRTLSGLMYPEEGTVTWRGESIRRDLSGYQAEMAYIGHEPPLKADLTAEENLRYWVGVRKKLDQAGIGRQLERMGANQWANRPVRTLSAGQKRRVALAGLLLMGVPLWLLDEPTTNLDADGQRLVGTLIEEHLATGGLAVAAIHHELALPATLIRRLELTAGDSRQGDRRLADSRLGDPRRVESGQGDSGLPDIRQGTRENDLVRPPPGEPGQTESPIVHREPRRT